MSKDMQDEWQIKKQKRIQYILEELEKQNDVDREYLKSSLSVHYGFHKPTVDEYLKDLQRLGIIEVDKNNVIHYKGEKK